MRLDNFNLDDFPDPQDLTYADPTRIDIETDPTTKRMVGIARHGNTPFDVPYISKIGHNLWQGGCKNGLTLPRHIKHVVSLYKWERYRVEHELLSEMYVEMYDSIEQGTSQVGSIAAWINVCRKSGAVLVHCQAGLNRSSLVAARALYLEGQTRPEGDRFSGDWIVQKLRESRSPAVLCNLAFEAEVKSWV